MIIAVWSPTRFAGRKSSNLLLLALQEIEAEGGEQLILHMDPEGSGPEHFLLSGHHRRRMVEQKEFGVEALCKVLLCERFSKEAVKNAAYTFADGKLHILPAGSRSFYEEIENRQVMCDILHAAGKEFQNVWIELPAGDVGIREDIFEKADCIIVNFAQSPWEVEKLSKLPGLKKVFYIVGAYEQRNIYTVHNLMLMFPGLRGRCIAIPYCSAFSEACCGGAVEHFWKRKGSTGEEKMYPAFFKEVEKMYRKWKEGCVKSLCGEKDDGPKADRS